MQLEVYRSLWGHNGPLSDALEECVRHGWHGLEGAVPSTLAARRELRDQLDAAGLGYIAEICTAGSYVPNRQATPAEHLRSLREQAECALECAPQFLTVIAGCDAWSLAVQLDFFRQAAQIEHELGIALSFETHRSRSLFNPWIAREILGTIPNLKFTCDFSHWCVVCERLIDTEPDILALCAQHAHHIHARVGYAQGPQVPHPAAPEYSDALAAHESWWAQIWEHQLRSGRHVTTLTPEFGPDGYLHKMPFTDTPVADLLSINQWMAHRQKQRFADFVRRHTSAGVLA